MSFIPYNEDYKIETEPLAKFEDSGDRLYSYRIISKLPASVVKDFCMNNLHKCYLKNDKPNPFAPELYEFKNVTKFGHLGMGDMFVFKVKKPSTS